jgi:hypothetical protein
MPFTDGCYEGTPSMDTSNVSAHTDSSWSLVIRSCVHLLFSKQATEINPKNPLLLCHLGMMKHQQDRSVDGIPASIFLCSGDDFVCSVARLWSVLFRSAKQSLRPRPARDLFSVHVTFVTFVPTCSLTLHFAALKGRYALHKIYLSLGDWLTGGLSESAGQRRLCM